MASVVLDGEAVKKAQDAKGLMNYQVARAAGVAEPVVSKARNNWRISLKSAQKIASVLDVSLKDLRRKRIGERQHGSRNIQHD